MNVLEKLKSGFLYFDGGMGTLLQSEGLRPGELPETWNKLRPDKMTELHCRYLRAGSNIINTNTFGANPLKFGSECDEIVRLGVVNARRAVESCADMGRDHYVALDIGPLGKILKPFGTLPFEEAVELFAAVVKAGAEGSDLVIIETMNDAYETKAAVLAAKENCDLPIFVTTVYDERGKLMTGADPAAMAAMLEGLGVDAYGMNCSLGPRQMLSIVPELVKNSSIPVIVNPNAGLPKSVNGETVYDVDADEFSDVMVEIALAGATVLGGCCGTTPEFIAKTVAKTENLPFRLPEKKNETVVSSYTHAVAFGDVPLLIGERINPTGKKKVKEALRESNMDYLLSEAVSQMEAGAHILDVNVGLPEIDESEMMYKAVTEIQAVTDLPLQIDTVDPATLERALRIYSGKPLINSVNGKAESMKAVLPLAAKYGGVVIALTIDEDGIPDTAEGRVRIAEKIIAEAAKYGIEKKDIVVDPLAMTISSDTGSAAVTLEAVRRIREELGVHVSLGVSNISFGLPHREIINSTFFAMAMERGLSAAIMNPMSVDMMKTYRSFVALSGCDESCMKYIDFASSLPTAEQKAAAPVSSAPTEESDTSPLRHAIVKGLCSIASDEAKARLENTAPLDVIAEDIIPALDKVGKGFEEKTVFLPQLLMSAEAAKAAFEAVKERMPASAGEGEKVVLATVKGDIHDIGKNIVRVLLENYGFNVIDLGRDVPPEAVCDATVSSGAQLVGLSALMTTTVPSMEATIKQLRVIAPGVKVVVGGAVLTQEYADMIGADYYAKDAMETVRYAQRLLRNE
jgi:5-methyltetrahydrofolate--homocysteine methyltransferase